MKTIQIACVPADWDASTITAVGMCRNGRRALPVTTVAGELAEPWLTVWHGLVDALRGVAPGEWAATYIACELVELPAEEDAEPRKAVQLTIHRRWDDMTTCTPVVLMMADTAAVEFFNYLTRDEQ